MTRTAALKVLVGKKLTDLAPTELAGALAAAERVLVDVGTGDARTAYRQAVAHPEWLVIGVDPAWQRMTETAVRAARKPAKGGAPNLVLVSSAIETVPAALHGVADEVTVLMPWGKLLRGVVLGETDVLSGLRAVAKPGAPLEISIGTSIWRDPIPLEIRDLPELTPEAVASTGLADRLAALGWQLADVRLVPHTELDTISSSWARRLGSGATETVLHLRAIAVDPRDPVRPQDAAAEPGQDAAGEPQRDV
ncbi:rRNA methyltransferase [Catenulispora sp. NF23]|uniref:rRNA methyltransferase n=1 Tax=Catenulispora pinistramenti TaxID=2705254 RepID=UPI001BABF6B4|nr:rRNA methyltransferase [Catenulispora pinistramenti]MBS2534049.1 rRNA methyltransferase [Catenulispora pinistramenti]